MSSHPSSAPYARLDPNAVLSCVEHLGFRGDGRILQLNSYENRVFQLHLDDGEAVVAKFYRPQRWSDAQLLEEHAFARDLANADIPVVAPLALQAHPGASVLGEPPTLGCVTLEVDTYRLSVSPRRAGRAPNLESPDVLRWLGRYLGRMHVEGARQPFAHRRTLNVDTYGVAACARIAELDSLADDSRESWLSTCQTALAWVRRRFDEVQPTSLRLHGDFHPGNVLWREADDHSPGGPHIVDLDDACNGPAIQDLWMLLSGDDQALRTELNALLEGYEVFRPFERRELRLIEPLRTLRMIHHSAWIAERWNDPAFPTAFPWFGTRGYWDQQVTQLKEQIATMVAQDGD